MLIASAGEFGAWLDAHGRTERDVVIAPVQGAIGKAQADET